MPLRREKRKKRSTRVVVRCGINTSNTTEEKKKQANEYTKIMSCEDLCESPSGFFGVAGTCNTTSGECICPENYWGEDDWDSYEGCSVRIPLQRLMWIVQLGTHGLCLLIGISNNLNKLNKLFLD